MDKWEYKIESLKRDDNEKLNKLGAEGWELISVIDSGFQCLTIYLKRRKI